MTVCFIGHRTVDNAEQIKTKLFDTLSTLIAKGTDTFIFGSRSDFDCLCWEVVTKLKESYPHIKRISCNAPHETVFTSTEERERYEYLFSQIVKHTGHYADYEEAVSSQKSLKANKNTYIMRNQEMIDGSDVCVFYYNKDYLPPRRKQSKRSVFDYQPKSGTAIAVAYALQKKKIVINIYDN
ncbi:MAG: DUF1273 family protein [Clostridiales bacterium]|nr:DUF1273 family protein [Clostridiales bacterium]